MSESRGDECDNILSVLAVIISYRQRYRSDLLQLVVQGVCDILKRLSPSTVNPGLPFNPFKLVAGNGMVHYVSHYVS